jgi:hypothetical protein
VSEFVAGDDKRYAQLRRSDAIGISSKSKFFTDLKDDNLVLNRNYFPGVDLNSSDENAKKSIINEIEEDFRVAYEELLNYLLRLSLVFIPLLYIIKIAKK